MTSAPETIPLQIDALQTTALLHRADDPHAPVVLLVPALGVPAGAYKRVGQALAARGVHLLTLDLRGVGSSSIRARRGVDWGYLDLVDGELRALHALAARELPQSARVLLGHSLGGQLALLHQARHADQAVARVLLVASGSPWTRAYPLRMRIAVSLLLALAACSARAFGVFRGDLLNFGGKQGVTKMREWARLARRGRFGRLGREHWDADAALASLQRPIAALSMRGDHYAPRAATEHLASLTAGRTSVDSLDRVDGGKAPGHFLWMKHPEGVAAWVAEQARGEA